MNIKKIIGLAALIAASLSPYAQTGSQSKYPKVGAPCPDFTLRNIRYYPKKQATLKDFAGKWLVLDFWNKGCSACVASFPRISTMQKQFADKVQFMMVGVEDREKEIEPKFAKYREKENLVMPAAFDSLLAQRWNIYTAPHYIILDDRGMVQGVTNSLHAEQVQALLEGKHPYLSPTYSSDPADTLDHHIPFDAKKPFLVDGNGGADTDFLYRSILSKWTHNQHWSTPMNMTESEKDGKFQVIGVPLQLLYDYAYFGVAFPGGSAIDSTRGKYQDLPILEMKDTSLFQYSYDQDQNLFAYSLIVPKEKASVANLERIMQNDLRSYFGFEAGIETRKCPCWKLTATAEAKKKLQTKGGAMSRTKTKNGVILQNFPFATLLNNLRMDFQQETIIDETGILGNIDLKVKDGVWSRIHDAASALKACGLELVPGEKNMKVVVIRDAKP